MARTSHLLILLALLGLAGLPAHAQGQDSASQSPNVAPYDVHAGNPLFGPASRQAEHERR